jgi:excisionase family DNA binding protein
VNDLPTSSAVEDFAKRHGVCRVTVYKEIAEGRLRTFKVGRRRLISSEAERQWIESREAEGRAA